MCTRRSTSARGPVASGTGSLVELNSRHCSSKKPWKVSSFDCLGDVAASAAAALRESRTVAQSLPFPSSS